MNFNNILKSLFGDKSSRDMKLIQPLVEQVKAVYPDIEKLSHDELRAKSREMRRHVQDAAKPYLDKIAELKGRIEDTPIDEREPIFDEIDKQDKEMLDALEQVLNEVMPTAYSIVKDTALPRTTRWWSRPPTSTASSPPTLPTTLSPSTATKPSTTTSGRPAETR